MVYANDEWVQVPVMQLYDTGLMQSAINNARYMYEKAEKRMDDFYKEYDNFYTPIQKDQDWYNENVIGKFRRGIDELYARGEDPLRTASGRAKLAALARSIDVGSVNKLRSSAKAAEEYIKNRGILDAAGKYNKDLEERFLGYNLSNWDTLGGGQIWSRTAPTEMKTLKELTESWYNNRTARDLTEADLKAAGIPYDKRYQYTGYLDSDIMNVAKGNTPGWNDSVYSGYYRDLARRQLERSGVRNITQDMIEKVLQRNIADAQQEWLINPTKHADQFAVMNQQFSNQWALQKDAQKFQKDMAEQAAKDKLDQIRARYGFKTGQGRSGNNYSLTEELHHDLLFQGLRNSGIQIPVTEIDKNGKRVVKYDKNGKMLVKSIDEADFGDLEFAANYQNRYGVLQQEFVKNLTTGSKYDPIKAWNKFKQRYGGKITNIQLAALLKKNPQQDGGFILSIDQAKKLRSAAGIMSDIRGSQKKMTYSERINQVLPKDVPTDQPVEIKFVLDDTYDNATQAFEKYNRGRTEIYASGTVTYTWEEMDGSGHKIKKQRTVENVQLPTGINSEINAKNKTNTSLSGANRSAYSSQDANYLKLLGQQQNTNIGLFANQNEFSPLDMSTMTMEEYMEFLQNNQQ